MKRKRKFDKLYTVQDLHIARATISELQSESDLPSHFLPAYLIFVRLDDMPFSFSTNFYFDDVFKFRKWSQNHAELQSILLNIRTEYINSKTPWITEGEKSFKDLMTEMGIEKIEKDNQEARKLVYNIKSIDGGTSGYHSWMAALQIKSGKWSFPCSKCELVHQSYNTWTCSGERMTRWLSAFKVNNCGEPLALSMAYRAKEKLGELEG